MFLGIIKLINKIRHCQIMLKKCGGIVLFLIFFLVLGSRFYFAFSTPYFSSDKAYFNLRQIENIKQKGFPLFNDDLSYSGNTFIFSPVFHYSIAFFALFMPAKTAAKVIPNIFSACVVFFIFLIVNKITKNQNIALFLAFVSGFVPVFFSDLNNISVYSLIFPLIFLLIFLFLNIRKKYYFYSFILVLVLLSFISPFVLVFCAGLLLYQLLLILGDLKRDGAEIEISLFSVFFALWVQFLLYKKLFLFHGLSVIWQNIPNTLFSNYFSSINALEAIYMVGVVPLIYGIFIIFRYLFKQQRKDIYLLMSFALLTGILLWFRLIVFKIGLMFAGLLLILLFSQHFKLFIHYVRQTRASRFLYFFIVFIGLAFVVSSVIPSIALAKKTANNYISEEEINALSWINEKTPSDSVVVASVYEGNIISYFAKRKNIFDSYFFMRNDVEERLKDVRKIFTSSLEIEAVELMNKYEADYIYFSRKSMNEFDVCFLKYVSSGSCFEKIYGNNLVSIYHKQESCRLKVVG